MLQPKQGWFGGGKKNTKKNDRIRKTKSQRNAKDARDVELQQREFDDDVAALREEIAATVRHLKTLALERQFPHCMQWKLRLDAGDGLFVGIRDLEVEKLNANFQARTGPAPGQISVKVFDIESIVGLYQFSITGSSAKAKIMSGLLTPTINRLDMKVTGEWNLVLDYESGKNWKSTSSLDSK